MIQCSTFWGSEKYENRKAEVMKNDQGFYVDMYFNGELVESRPLYNHSESYAEDCAENYVIGVIP